MFPKYFDAKSIVNIVGLVRKNLLHVASITMCNTANIVYFNLLYCQWFAAFDKFPNFFPIESITMPSGYGPMGHL